MIDLIIDFSECGCTAGPDFAHGRDKSIYRYQVSYDIRHIMQDEPTRYLERRRGVIGPRNGIKFFKESKARGKLLRHSA